jgi:hypothetical protein
MRFFPADFRNAHVQDYVKFFGNSFFLAVLRVSVVKILKPSTGSGRLSRREHGSPAELPAETYLPFHVLFLIACCAGAACSS